MFALEFSPQRGQEVMFGVHLFLLKDLHKLLLYTYQTSPV